MKKLLIILGIFSGGFFPVQSASAQADEIAQLLLNVEKLAQFKQILSDMKKGYTILKGGYNTVKDIAEGNFNLHKAFLDGLSKVSPEVKNYRKVGEIISSQKILVQEYRRAYERFRSDENFSPQELSYLGRVYDNLFKQSIRNLDELITILTPGTLRMSDDERLKAIDRVHADLLNKVEFLHHFNSQFQMLGIDRAREKQDVQILKTVHGITK